MLRGAFLALMLTTPILAWWLMADPTGQPQMIVGAILAVPLLLLVLWGATFGRGVQCTQDLYEQAVRRRKQARALEERVYGPRCPDCKGSKQRLAQVYYDRTDTSELGIQSLRTCPRCEGTGHV